MLDIKDYQFSGVSFATYAFLTLTTGILAYATLAEESGGSVASSAANVISQNPIVETITNPSKLLEMNPTVIPEASPAQPIMQGGAKRRRTKRRIRGAASTATKRK